MRRMLNPVLAYRLLLCLLVFLGIQPLRRLPQEIGQLYLGVPLNAAKDGTYFVNLETAYHRPGIQAGLRGGDHLLALEGRSLIHAPRVFSEIYSIHKQDDTVQVRVRRGDNQLTLSIPLSRYRLVEALEFHGLWFLAGLSALLSAWLLFSPPSVLMALAMTLIAGMMFAHGYSGCAVPRLCPHYIHPLQVIWEYGYALVGALFFHFAWRFPPRRQVSPLSLRLDSIGLIAIYTLAFTVGTINMASEIFRWVKISDLFSQIGVLLAAVGGVAILIRLVWLWLSREPGQTGARVIVGVWGVGLFLFLGIGVLPFWSEEAGMLLTQFLLSIEVIYPLLLVYAVRQVELVEKLEHEVAQKKRWADMAQELQEFREEDLRQVAAELHDTVLNDLRAVGIRLEGLMSVAHLPTTERGSHPDQEDQASTDELMKLWESMQQIKQQAERVMKGAMPLDFKKTTLTEALNEALKRFKRKAPGVEARLKVGSIDTEPPPAVREEMYWIAVSALNNCWQHAQASQVEVFASATQGRVQMMIRDDGVGFDEKKARPNALGLRNMRARAEQLGAKIEINSDSRGTTIHFSLTLPQERAIRVLVVEDGEMFVAGLQSGLAQLAPEVEIVGVVNNAQEAVVQAQKIKPDIVLLDLRIREGPQTQKIDPRYGLQALVELKRTTQVCSVAMSVIQEPALLRAAFKIGAWAFWNKDQDVATLVNMLRQVAAGECVLPEEQGADESEQLAEDLTLREWEVLLCLEEGLSDQEIANRMGISDRTVEKHGEGLRGKLEVHSRLEAVARARELGLLPSGRPEFQPPDSLNKISMDVSSR